MLNEAEIKKLIVCGDLFNRNFLFEKHMVRIRKFLFLYIIHIDKSMSKIVIFGGDHLFDVLKSCIAKLDENK